MLIKTYFKKENNFDDTEGNRFKINLIVFKNHLSL